MLQMAYFSGVRDFCPFFIISYISKLNKNLEILTQNSSVFSSQYFYPGKTDSVTILGSAVIVIFIPELPAGLKP